MFPGTVPFLDVLPQGNDQMINTYLRVNKTQTRL